VLESSTFDKFIRLHLSEVPVEEMDLLAADGCLMHCTAMMDS
jgi:hypothetical protein